MFPASMLAKSFIFLSLTNHPTPTSTTRPAIDLLRTLSQDADLKPLSKTTTSSNSNESTDEGATRFALLADLLHRRAAIFSQYRKVLLGKEKQYAGIQTAEAHALWEEVEGKLGVVMRAWVQGEVFSEEQVGELKEMVCPHFDWA